MSALLFLPGLCVILFRAMGALNALKTLTVFVGGIQVLLGAPFFLSDPSAYVHQAFDFSRVFLDEWTVNWRVIDENTFLHPITSKILLTLHLTVLTLFGLCRWTAIGYKGHYWVRKHWRGGEILAPRSAYLMPAALTPAVLLILCTSNLIGITFARSLHYQFYSWYAWQIPLLIWASRLCLPLRCVELLASNSHQDFAPLSH